MTPSNPVPPIVPETPTPPTARTEVWRSDAIARMLQRLEVPYVALVPGASFRGLHDSLVNDLGNKTPQMLTCIHEESRSEERRVGNKRVTKYSHRQLNNTSYVELVLHL